MQQVGIWSIISSLAGFLFGFDTVVISGAEKAIRKIGRLTPAMHGVAMASALYGTVRGGRSGAAGRSAAPPHGVCAAVITTIFPAMAAAFPPAAIFGFFAGMMVLQLVWVLAMVAETRGGPPSDFRVR